MLIKVMRVNSGEALFRLYCENGIIISGGPSDFGDSFEQLRTVLPGDFIDVSKGDEGAWEIERIVHSQSE